MEHAIQIDCANICVVEQWIDQNLKGMKTNMEKNRNVKKKERKMGKIEKYRRQKRGITTTKYI